MNYQFANIPPRRRVALVGAVVLCLTGFRGDSRSVEFVVGIRLHASSIGAAESDPMRNVAAQSGSQEVLFAGAMFVTDAADIAGSFPLLSQVLRTEPWVSRSLDLQLGAQYDGFRAPSFVLNAKDLGRDLASAPLVMGLAFDSELVSVERFSGVVKMLGEMSAQALFFDYRNRVVLAAYPIVVRQIVLMEAEPGPEDSSSLVSSLLESSSEVTVLKQFGRVLRSASLKLDPKFRLGIKSATYSASALRQMPLHLQGHPESAQRALANRLAQFVATNQGIAMVPYSPGQAIAGRMALRYANGESVNLQLPEPDFVFELEIRDFKKALQKAGAGADLFAYAVFARLRVTGPRSGLTYLDIDFRHTGTKTVPSTQQSVDDWAAYQDVTFDLLDELTQRLADRELDTWLKPRLNARGQAIDTTAIRQLMEKVK